nr:EF-hand calcium-binding domain-containing protein 12 [Pogona vitticeps]
MEWLNCSPESAGSPRRRVNSERLPGSASSVRLGGSEESSVLSNEQSPKESPVENLDGVLDHCFKQFKLREAHPHFFLKVKGNRFGPPRSRRRILIAPPMRGGTPGLPQSWPSVPSGPEEKKVLRLETTPEAEDKTSKEEEDMQELEAWIEERKKLQDLLKNCVSLEEWLTAKQPISQLEVNVLGRIRENREAKTANAEAKLAAVSSIEHLMPKRAKKRIVPLIHAPYPESLITLQMLLHKQKLKLVDLFNKADRSKSMKFKRADFIRIIEATKVPISKSDLEDIILFLTTSTKGNYITSDDLAECQRIWADKIRDQWKNTKESKPDRKELPLGGPKAASVSTKRVSSGQNKAKELPVHIDCLQVPPPNTEPECVHLTYNQMEMVGKRYREMRRQLKRKVDPLSFAEQCRMVKTGDLAVDGHCLPSTMEGEVGDLVDHHRLATHLVYTQCVKLCKKYQVPLTEKVLKRGLLYPGDRILREGNSFRKIRQPGGYYSKSMGSEEASEEEESRVSSRVTKRKPQPKAEKKQVINEKTMKYRWQSFEEFKKLMTNRSKKLLPPVDFWVDPFYYDDIFKTPEEVYEERQLRKMFAFLNPLTDANSFWPGHLLDKLRLYLPQTQRHAGDALFSHVSCTRPVYPGIYTPDRHWPVSDRGYVIYGDPESRKHHYYI